MRIFSRLHLLFVALALSISAASFGGFSVQNGQLLDGNRVPFIMRGVNYPYTWFQSRPTQQDLAAIAATGANTVRLVLSTGGQWARVNGPQVAQLIQWCKELKMIAVLEVHDSTGWSEQSTAVHINNAVQYWTSADIRAAINGQEDFVIVNIANEPFGNNTSANYTPDTQTAIQALRTAGLTHTIMIDAANWGQDWTNTMRNSAMQLWLSDTRRNLVFSVHMYEVYQSLSTVSTYMQAFADLNLPLVVGEFGPINNGQFADSESVIAQAQTRGLGYLGWSWSGNGGGGTGLDMTVNFSSTFTAWGERIVNGLSGIRTTSIYATVFPQTGGSSLVVTPTALTFPGAASSRTVAVTANVSWSVTNNTGFATISPLSGTGNGNIIVNVPPNANIGRQGIFTITGGGITRQVVLTQDPGAPGAINVSTTALALPATAATGTFQVTSNINFGASSNQPWLTISPTNGSQPGATVTVTAAANTGTTARTANVLVFGGSPLLITRTVTVTQAAPATNFLTLSVPPTAVGPGGLSVTLTIMSNVSWTITDDQPWITIAPTSGSGTANVTMTIAANPLLASRTGSVIVSGGGLTRTFTITQAGQSNPNPGGGTCPNPVTFTGNTGNFNTAGAVCYRTNANINGWGCYNFDGRTLTVGGVARTCGQMPLTRAADGYYYFAATAGQFPWAGIFAW